VYVAKLCTVETTPLRFYGGKGHGSFCGQAEAPVTTKVAAVIRAAITNSSSLFLFILHQNKNKCNR